MFSQGQTYVKFREEMEVRWIQVRAAWWVAQDSEKFDPVLDNFINIISVSLVGWHSEVSLIATRHSNWYVRRLHLGQTHHSSEQCRCQYSSPINNCHSLLDVSRWNIYRPQELGNSTKFLSSLNRVLALLHSHGTNSDTFSGQNRARNST